jgi:hypothetical protein
VCLSDRPVRSVCVSEWPVGVSVSDWPVGVSVSDWPVGVSVCQIGLQAYVYSSGLLFASFC